MYLDNDISTPECESQTDAQHCGNSKKLASAFVSKFN